MTANNAQWVGFSLEIGPDGGLYALDWHDADICGQEVLHSETGRIFRMSYTENLAQDFKGRYEDLNELSDQELVELQTTKSDWHARRARGILQKRKAKGSLQSATIWELKEIFQKNNNSDHRLRALWTLHQTGGFSEKELIQNLEDSDQHIRAWAIQLLCEDLDPSDEALSRFILMAKEDKSPVVRLYLAGALPRITSSKKWDIASHLLQHEEDSSDHNLPKMIWYGIEPLMAQNADNFLEMSLHSKIPMVTQFMARRAVDADELDLLVTTIGKSEENASALLEGMLSGMEGRTDLNAPMSWKTVAERLQQSNAEHKEYALAISDLFGDAEATRRALSVLKDRKAPLEQRNRALKLLTAQQRAELVQELPILMQDPEIRLEAIRSVAAFDSEALGKLLIDNYGTFSQEEKTIAIQTLSSRPRYGNMLASEIKENRIPKKEVSPSMARQLLRVVGSGFIEIWGAIETVPNDDAAYQKYRNLLTGPAMEEGNLQNGKTLFQNTCGTCHKMYGEGEEMGPDLTGSNRTDVDYILLNVLDPSAEIQDDYKMVVITTRDGRNYSGNVIAENERQLTLRVIGQDPVIINKSAIQSREATPVSMMPPGLFENMDDKEIIDLVSYLGINKPI